MQEQPSLFDLDKEELPITDGRLTYYSDWLNNNEASQLLTTLKQQVAWQQSTINIYGKSVKIPRLNAWYGDAECPYQYSGKVFSPLPWLPCLWEQKLKIEQITGFSYNSVLVNCYRDGNDSVAWHSDDEPELGRNPPVASLSLGAERTFQLRHRYNKDLAIRKLNLGHGSLLIMSGELQHHWHHQLPKVANLKQERINLTYRYVRAGAV